MTNNILAHKADEFQDPQRNTAAPFFARLWRGGKYAYWHTQPDRRSTWFSVDDPQPLPRKPRANIYFGVHPMKCIPPTNAEGEPQPPELVRGQHAHLAAVNCLYAEFDAAHFAGGKAEALEHLQALAMRPSAVVDSGGGYHAYWLLRDPFIINTPADFAHVHTLQRRWVLFVAGDTRARDLARVLRVPGTRNYKPKYGPDGAPVEFVWLELNRLYTLPALAAMLPEDDGPGAVAPVTPAQRPIQGTRAERYAQAVHRRQLDALARASEGARNDTLNLAAFTLARFVGVNLLDEHTVAGDLLRLAVLRGLPAGEAERTIRSGMAAGVGIAPALPEDTQPPDDDPTPTGGGTSLTQGWDQLAAMKERAHAARLAIGRAAGKEALQAAGVRTGEGMIRTIDAMLEIAEKTGRPVIAPGLHLLAEKAGCSRPTVNRHLAVLFEAGQVDLSRDVETDGPRTPWHVDLTSLVKSVTQEVNHPLGCVTLLTSDGAAAALGWFTLHRADDAFTPYPMRYVLRRGLRHAGDDPPIVPPVFLRNLPPMARQVWRGLLEHGELSIAGMIDELGIGQSSARNACRRLEEDGYIVADVQGRAHEKVYRLAEGADSHLDAARPHMQSYGVNHRRKLARTLEVGISAEEAEKAAADPETWRECRRRAQRVRVKLGRLVDDARRAGVDYRVRVWRKANAWLRYDHTELERENTAALLAWKGTAGTAEVDRRRMMIDAGWTMPDIWNAKRLELRAAPAQLAAD